MGSLKEVRTRITSVKSTQQITKAMKVVSAAKLRKAQGRVTSLRPYAGKLQYMLSQLAGSLEDSDAQVWYKPRELKKVLIVVITSDRGLAGSFNSTVAKEVINSIKDKYSNQTVELLTIGKKGRDALHKSGYKIIEEHNSFFNKLNYEESEAIGLRVMDAFLKGDYDAIDIVYNAFKNAAVFITTHDRFLPIPAPQNTQNQSGNTVDYIFEPNKEEILSRLISKSMMVNFFRMLLESNAAEHGARMTSMDKATENAEDLLRKLKLQYNKERQAMITKEILEIVGGAKALNG